MGPILEPVKPVGIDLRDSDLKWSPEQKAHFEVLKLWSEFSSRSKIVLGGPTPPEMQAKNDLLWAEYARQKAAIFARHGVAPTD